MVWSCCSAACKDRCGGGEDDGGDLTINKHFDPYLNPQLLSLGYVPTSMDVHSPIASPLSLQENQSMNGFLNPESPLFQEAATEGLELNSRTIGLALQFYKTILYRPVKSRIKWQDQIYEGRYMFFYERHPKFCISLFPHEERDHTVVSTLSNNADSDILALRGKSPAGIYASPPSTMRTPGRGATSNIISTGRSMVNTPGRGPNEMPLTPGDRGVVSYNRSSGISDDATPLIKVPPIKGMNSETTTGIPKQGISMLTNNAVSIANTNVMMNGRHNAQMIEGRHDAQQLSEGDHESSLVQQIQTNGSHSMLADVDTNRFATDATPGLSDRCSSTDQLFGRGLGSERGLGSTESILRTLPVEGGDSTYGSLKADFAEVTIRWKWKWNLRDLKVTSDKNIVTIKNNRESLDFIEESEARARLLRNSLRTLQLAWIHDSLAVYSIAEQVYVC